jgi:predicted nucleotidyltransferase
MRSALTVLEDHREALQAFCRRHYIRHLALFGSGLGDDFDEDSDIDLLVLFEPGHVPGLDFFAMEAELSRLLGHPVDLNTPQFLSPAFRDQVLAEARVIYG